MKECMIVAPHGDDEIIGCYRILQNKNIEVIHILYGDNLSYIPQALSSCQNIEFKQANDLEKFKRIDMPFFFPDPIFETHPDHRFWGSKGEELVRNGENVYFYSVNMLAPYIYEVLDPNKKREFLEKCYPEKQDLWRFDHKYFLFEGYCKWIPGGRGDII